MFVGLFVFTIVDNLFYFLFSRPAAAAQPVPSSREKKARRKSYVEALKTLPFYVPVVCPNPERMMHNISDLAGSDYEYRTPDTTLDSDTTTTSDLEMYRELEENMEDYDPAADGPAGIVPVPQPLSSGDETMASIEGPKVDPQPSEDSGSSLDPEQYEILSDEIIPPEAIASGSGVVQGKEAKRVNR